MPVDFMSVLKAGQGLVPDMREQLWQDQQRNQQNDVNNLKIEQARQTQQRQGQLQQDLAGAVQSGDPRAIARLMAKYPEFAGQIKPSWEALSKDAQQTNVTQTGVIYERVRNGDVKGAADMLRKRYDADLAAGQADETTKEVIDALDSGDPQQIKVAAGTLGIMLAAATGEKFTDTYGKLNPTDAIDPLEKKYNFILRTKGQEAADRFLDVQSDEAIAVQAGGSVFKKSDVLGVGGPQVTQNPRGGDQSTGGQGVAPTGQAIESTALQAVPGLIVTSRKRSSSKNTAVGGVDGSYHLTDQARDFVAPKGMSMGSLRDRLKQVMPGFDVINEGDHVHVEPSGSSARNAAPTRVRSIQEAMKLKPGTRYVTPEGEEYVR